MWISRDVSAVIVLAVMTLIYSVLVFQLGFLFTGIPGANYFFIIGQAILSSFALLYFEGRRWRLFSIVSLFGIISLPTYSMGTPFNVLPRIPLILGAFQADLLFNSLYFRFKKSNLLLLWAVIYAVENFIVDGVLRLVTYPIFYPSEYVSMFAQTFFIMLPVIIIEAVFGGIIGFKVYQRIENETIHT